MTKKRSGSGWLIAAVVGGAAVAGIVVLSRAKPDSSLRRYVDTAESVARNLPSLTREAIQEAKNRVEAAKAEFTRSRAESERALFAQFDEAKQRGSLPPG